MVSIRLEHDGENVNVVAEATNVHGLTGYLIGMILIGGALVWASHTDHERDKRRQAIAKR
jgi:hypothetical protein